MPQRRRLPDDRFKKKRQPVQKPNTMRLFLAIFPPDSYKDYFRNVLRELDKQKRNLRPTPVDQLHIDVKFIGPEVSYQSKDELLVKLQSMAGKFPRPEIKIKPVQFGFPYQKDPIHLIAEVEENKELTEISDMVHSLLKEMSLLDTIRWKVKHSDSFHITIGRTRPNASRSLGRDIHESIDKINLPLPEPFQVEFMDLMESQITLTGPVYKKLGRIKL